MFKKAFILVFIIASFLSTQAHSSTNLLSVNVEQWLEQERTIWGIHNEVFMQRSASIGFTWMSANKEVAVVNKSSTLTFLGMPITEARMQFNQSRLSLVTLFLYSRGDDGDLSKKQFMSRLHKIQSSISGWAKVRPQIVKNQLKTMGVKRKAQTWALSPYLIQLTWSYSTKNEFGSFAFRAEYIKWECKLANKTPIQSHRPLRRKSSSGREVSIQHLQSRIKRKVNGDVFIEGIPMVDQGEKGYCAVASAERVLRHYGIQVDQHEVAQLASSSALKGTDPSNMINALKRVGVKLGCVIKVHKRYDAKDFLKMLKQYNKLARKRKKPEVPLYGVMHIAQVYSYMDMEILKSVQMKNRLKYHSFSKAIQESVNSGIPLAWSVIVGLIKEDPEIKGIGGHMRLIIGYNTEEEAVLYSDSWGPGHELKRMALDDAWTITKGLHTIEPRWKLD